MLYVFTWEVVKNTATEMISGAKINFQDGSINTWRWTPKKIICVLEPETPCCFCKGAMQLFIKKTYLRDFEQSQTNLLAIPPTQQILFIRIL